MTAPKDSDAAESNAPAPSTAVAEARALQLLRSVFGYDSFRDQQEAIIAHLTAGGDALVLMPTGSGKSLCYQIPALLRDGVGIVVSPLIALMKDQVDALAQAGVRAAALNSSLAPGEAARIERAMEAGKLDLVYIAPERLTMPRTLDLLARVRLALFAIDEAHCVSQWGHDFRPEYLALSVLHERFPAVPRIALTATADGVTRRDIAVRLNLGEARVFASGFDRPNIRYRVAAKYEAKAQLLAFIAGEHAGDAGIVYCRTRSNVDELAGWLAGKGVSALPYHAGLEPAMRAQHQDRFLKEEGVVVVATVAFGMGIDKPNVRFVAHSDVPKSLEAYYQETGRAGRDGLPADAWMSYGMADVTALRGMLARNELEEAQRRIEQHKLAAMLGYCETVGCRRRVLLGYFGERHHGPCGNCDNCLSPPAAWDGRIAAQKALSAVARTGQRFGVEYLIDILLGKTNERVRRFGHDRLKTFGVGSELNERQWRAVFRQLVAFGHLDVDIEGHGGLRFGESAAGVLRGETAVTFREEPVRRPRIPRQPAAETPGGALSQSEEALWQALRARRLTLAKEQGVPPYVIFHDTTLREMARRRPRDRAALAEIPGVGTSKLARYGDIMLAVIGEAADARREPLGEGDVNLA